MLDQGPFLTVVDPTVYPRFVLALFGGSGAFSLLRGCRLLWFGDGSLHWPKARGVVQRSRVEHRLAMRGHVAGVTVAQQDGGYEVVIDYAYEVNGQTYSSDRWSFEGGLLLEKEADAAVKARQYREATPILVRYDPNDPGRSVIKPGGGQAGFILALGGLLVVLWALYGFVAA
jgi:hypothetical protein